MAFVITQSEQFPLRTSAGTSEGLDQALFEAFYRRNGRQLWSYIERMSGDRDAADDLLQKSFYQLLRSYPQMSDEKQLRPLVYRIATNLVHDFRRDSRRRHQPLSPSLAVESGDEQTIAGFDLQRAFAQLSERERALLWLAHVEELSHAEVAQILDVKTGSIKVLLFRARRKLAAILRGAGWDAGETE